MNESLQQKAERLMATECISRAEWCELTRELLAEITRMRGMMYEGKVFGPFSYRFENCTIGESYK